MVFPADPKTLGVGSYEELILNKSVMRGAGALVVGLATVAALASPAQAGETPVSTTTQAVSQTEGASVLAPRCGWQPGANMPRAAGFKVNGVRIRTGPSTGCTVKGLGYVGQSVTYRCSTIGDDGYIWYYLTNNSTGVRGWVREDNLTYNPIIYQAC